MKKLLTLILITMFVFTMTTAAYAAQTFTDVSTDHWAYDAVAKLVKSGLIDGYGDGTFRGEKPLNRYELAMLTVKAIDKYDKADAQQKALINKLSAEFAAELNQMGVRVAKVEAKTNAWVFGGDTRMRYLVNDPKYPNGAKWKTSEQFDIRQRIVINGTVADNFLMQARLVSNYGTKFGQQDSAYGSTAYFDIMNVTGKNVLGLDRIRAGRSAFDVMGNAFIGRPNCVDGIGIWKTMGALNFNAWTGNIKPDVGTANPSQMTTAQLTYKPTDDFKVGLGYYWADVPGSTTPTGTGTILGSVGSFSGSQGADLSVNYHMGNLWLMGDYVATKLDGVTGPLSTNPKGWVVQVSNGVGPSAKNIYFPVNLLVDKSKKGTDAWAVSYRSVDAGTIPNGVGGFDSTAVARAGEGYNVFNHGTDNQKALYLTYQSVLEKNVVLTFEWQDIKIKNRALAPLLTSDKLDQTFLAKFEFFY